jgi:SAM-dependent methyltransferase
VTAHQKIQAQLRYFAARQPVRMQPLDTAYVRRHFGEAARAVDLRPRERVCEWGAGMGRFSARLLRHGCSVTAVELSPRLAEVCEQTLAGSPQGSVAVGDILAVCERLPVSYDVVAGFFVLHHLPELEPYFRAARRLLAAGGRIVFVEPNPLNPLYALQISLTPGMRWREERGVYRMWQSAVRRAAESAGFEGFTVTRYGALPRAPYNWLARIGAERAPERLLPAPLRPFQVFAARLA